jgi:hypothetical protein
MYAISAFEAIIQSGGNVQWICASEESRSESALCLPD